MKKWKKLIVVVSVLLVMGVCILPLKKSIDTTINTVQWKLNEEDSTKNVTVRVKGTYNTYLFRKNSFEGNIYIDGYETLNNSNLQTVYFNDGIGYLVYQDNGDIMKMSNLGFIMCSSDFSELLIGVNSDNGLWKADSGIVICGEASNYSDALEIAKRLSEKSDWLSKKNIFGKN